MNPAAFQLRVMQVAFIVSVMLFYYVGITIHPAAQVVSRPMQWGIAFCAVSSALMGFFVQRILLRTPSQSSPSPQGSTARSRWFSGHVLRFATAESVALFGLLLLRLAGPSTEVYLLFGASLLLLLLWQPGSIPALAESQRSID
jgi:hypothetical protein